MQTEQCQSVIGFKVESLVCCLQGLQCHSITADEMNSQGLLSLSLRSLAAHDDGLR